MLNFINSKEEYIQATNELHQIFQEGVNKSSFEKGFYPKIIKGDKNITGQVKRYNKGSVVTTLTNHYSFEYLAFDISNDLEKSNKSIEELVKIGALDTMRLYRKNMP